MADVIRYIGGGIKCDNPECDYADTEVRIEDYNDWLNKPCPKCGANLLTQADYNNVQAIILATKWVNDKYVTDEVEEEPMQTIMTINMDGTGKMDFEFTDQKSE